MLGLSARRTPYSEANISLEYNPSPRRQRNAYPDRIPMNKRQDMVNSLEAAWDQMDHKKIGTQGHFEDAYTLPLDGKSDDLVYHGFRCYLSLNRTYVHHNIAGLDFDKSNAVCKNYVRHILFQNIISIHTILWVTHDMLDAMFFC